MSILEFPRVYFRGEVAWDPVTTNNYATDPTQYPPGQTPPPATYDEIDCDSDIYSQQVLTETQARDFRKAAIAEVNSSGNWNPDGSYRCPFYNTYITGVDLGAGLDTSDTFATAPVGFTGMLIDCEPYGALSSQLFFDDMSFGIQGGCRIYGKRITRFSDRFINFNANPSNDMIAGVASVMWQTGFAKDQGLQIDAHDSRVLQQLQANMSDPDVLGVMVRFVTYRTVYYNDPTLTNSTAGNAASALQAQLNAGGFQPNPARSLVVGTVGLWRRQDAMTEPSDRALIATMARVPGQKPPALHGPVVATAFARATSKGIALDFSNTIPCSDRATDKIDLGTLTLTASDPPPAVAVAQIATIDFSKYDRAAFEATSGIIDIELDGDTVKQIAGMNLAITAADGTRYLEEDVLRAVPLQPNLYVNQGEAASLAVQVYQRGVPVGAGVTVTMSDMNATQATAISAKTDSSGQASFALQSAAPEVIGWVFQTGDSPVLPLGNAFSPLKFTYAYQRVLPAESDIGNKEPNWDNVYTYVMANWHAMAPCMDNWLRLDDEQQVRSYPNIIKLLTDPASFENYRFMPITRDMSNGQRALLYNFLNSPVVVGAAPEVATAATSGRGDLAEKASPQSTVQQLSRSMRSGPGTQ
ncbi:MAG: hypothetical protein RL748_3511 [Pseudomonadota bacterium]